MILRFRKNWISLWNDPGFRIVIGNRMFRWSKSYGWKTKKTVDGPVVGQLKGDDVTLVVGHAVEI